ncbi:genetic suppressor element 1 isoform X21 [Homo sapiens]|uniref:genetic suppressor element 1 isoform X21 n=1 Tax=Homo sapiens TaxID=9606 RepID=UPI0007DC7D34|nr:genetic suppressor element 1 isoform X21 [Homo sapiens]
MSGRPAPVSRKQRLMAAVGERAAGGAPLSCFICGGGIGRGKELKLQVKQPAAGAGTPAQPFFPFLQQQEPAPGARELSPADGCVLVCAVCRCFLGEQWAAFERARTPVDKRMYWLKRPHQCDAGAGGRRGGAGAPREWNVAYALGSATGDDDEDDGGGPRLRGAAEETRDSDLSELSDTDPLSEPDPPARDAASPHQDGAPGPGPRGGRGQEWRPAPGPAPGQGAEASAQGRAEEEGLPAKAHADGEPKAGVRRRRKGVGRHWVPEARASVLRSIQDPWQGPLVQEAPADGMKGPPSGRATKTLESRPLGETLRGFCTSEDSDINITSGEEDHKEQPFPGVCNPKEKNSGRVPRALQDSRAAPAEGLCCYICGAPLSPASHHQVHVQKQEKLAQAPFFPFLWLHSPPPGAQPISEGGSTLVCASCFSSLTQQWQSFELANVPVLQRLYVVPLDSHAPGMASKGRRLPREEGLPSGALREACYLCGEDCTPDARAVPSRILNGNARSAMHFPFLSLLPCPPNAQGPNKRCEVRSCPKCFSVLEDVWALYRACQNEELITSVQGFLGRYHQAFSASDPALSELPASAQGGPVSICYICGAELGPGKEFQLNVNPASRLGEKEPFFPFLTVYPPAPRARPVDSTGLVATCVLCYHDLLAQWLQHEARSSHHAVSAWSRQYQVETFVCFFCQQEKKRCLGLKSVRVARLPLFLYTLRASHSLLVDDGQQLIIGACVECGTLVCAGQGLTRQGPMSWSSPVAAATKEPLDKGAPERPECGFVLCFQAARHPQQGCSHQAWGTHGGQRGLLGSPPPPSPPPAARSPGSLGSCGGRRCHRGNNTHHQPRTEGQNVPGGPQGVQNGLWVQPCCPRNQAGSRGWEEARAWPSGGLTCEPHGERQHPDKVSLPWRPGPCRGDRCFSHASTSFSSGNCVFFLIRVSVLRHNLAQTLESSWAAPGRRWAQWLGRKGTGWGWRGWCSTARAPRLLPALPSPLWSSGFSSVTPEGPF